ncbi:uncharacterized protein ColSpa_03202 [Colletotrichum spaethianum]|uniref:Uncharacterized protein n=1 Tax=Colletotrichum spaethianum TaxID=700344 RepID=A0AA37L747_9PEZI|nr:uncharacterized protein ColSpa_03202 [Colletotrichum spaethianum]GKT43021.1 hypothetical protein ColSpa_03202 [Colletotrichum spaethianum]
MYLANGRGWKRKTTRTVESGKEGEHGNDSESKIVGANGKRGVKRRQDSRAAVMNRDSYSNGSSSDWEGQSSMATTQWIWTPQNTSEQRAHRQHRGE